MQRRCSQFAGAAEYKKGPGRGGNRGPICASRARALLRPPIRPRSRPNPGCLLRGTHVLTPHGLKRVESLSIGDHLMTARGETSSRWPDSVDPICVARSALADNVPHANLYLSPLHALFIDDVVLQVAPLVNGTSIIPAAPKGMKDIEYLQIELATHEVILAEGAPVETHLNTNGREHYTNFVEYGRLYGRESGPSVPVCASTWLFQCSRTLQGASTPRHLSRS